MIVVQVLLSANLNNSASAPASWWPPYWAWAGAEYWTWIMAPSPRSRLVAGWGEKGLLRLLSAMGE